MLALKQTGSNLNVFRSSSFPSQPVYQQPPPQPQVSLSWRFPKDPLLPLPIDEPRGRHPSVVTARAGESGYGNFGFDQYDHRNKKHHDYQGNRLHSPYETIHRRTLIAPKKYLRRPKHHGHGTHNVLVDVYGYFRFAGNCPGNYLAGSPDATSLQDCANLCSAREDCAGFSFDPIDLMCVLKSADCWPPQPGSRQIFYHKDLKWQGPFPQPTEQPKLINVGQGHGHSASEYTGLPQTSNRGGLHGHEVKGMGMYSGEEDFDSYQHRFPIIPGYLRLDGNCHTEIIGIEEIPNGKACGAHCNLYPECAGFSFNFYHYKCILRAQSCMNPRESQHSNFYESKIYPLSIFLLCNSIVFQRLFHLLR